MNHYCPDDKNLPYFHIIGVDTALYLRSIALHPTVKNLSRPDDMSEREKHCYDKIVSAAKKVALDDCKLQFSLSAFEHSHLVDKWLVFNGFTIEDGNLMW